MVSKSLISYIYYVTPLSIHAVSTSKEEPMGVGTKMYQKISTNFEES